MKYVFFLRSDFELESSKRVRALFENFTARQILKQFVSTVEDFQYKTFDISMEESHLSPAHKLFASFSPILPKAVTAYTVLIQ